jgi:hypothetical protein
MPILGEKSILGAGLFWEREAYFWSVHNMGQKSNMQKRTCSMQKRKEKKHAKGGKTMWRACNRPSHLRVRVLDMNVMTISQ